MLLLDPMLCLSTCVPESPYTSQDTQCLRGSKQREGWFSQHPKSSQRGNKARGDICVAFRAANAEGGANTAEVGKPSENVFKVLTCPPCRNQTLATQPCPCLRTLSSKPRGNFPRDRHLTGFIPLGIICIKLARGSVKPSAQGHTKHMGVPSTSLN